MAAPTADQQGAPSDSITLRRDGPVIAALLVLILLVFFEVAFLDKSFTTGWNTVGTNGFNPPPSSIDVPGDPIRLDQGASAWAFSPWAEVNHDIYRNWSIPLWNPYQGLGAPQAANFQSAVFDPLLLPVNLFSDPLAWDVAFFLAHGLGIAAMYLFLRTTRIRRAAATAGAVVFSLSGFFLVYSNNHFFRTYVYLPVLFGLATVVSRSTRRWPVPALGAAVAGTLLIGMPEAALFVLLALAAYCITLVVGAREERMRVLARFGIAAVLGLMLAAPLLAPAAEYLPNSFSSHEPEHRVGQAIDPWEMLIVWVVPFARGLPLDDYLGLGFSGTRNWVGLAALAIVGLAMGAPRAMTRHRGWFFLALAAIVLAKCYGFPPLAWVGDLPVFVQVNFPVFALPLAGFAVATLVGIGVHGITTERLRWEAVLPTYAALLVGGIVLFYANYDSVAAAPAVGALKHWGLPALAAGGVVLAALAAPQRLRAIALTACVAAELLLLVPRNIYSEREDPFVHPEWLTAIQDRLSDPEHGQDRVFASDAKLFPNYAGAYRIQDIRSLDALYPDRYVDFIRTFVQPEFMTRFVGGPFGQHEEQRPAEVADNPMFDLAGVRYIITAGQDPGDDLVRDLFSRQAATATVRPAAFEIGGDRRPVIFVHGGDQASLPVPAAATRLEFSYAVDPAAFDDAASDGVEFVVALQSGDSEQVLWTAPYVPRSDPPRPEWREASIPLPQAIADSTVLLRVRGRSNTNTDWAGFAKVRFETPAGIVGNDRQFELIASSDGADVYENTHALPRAFVAHRPTVVSDEDAALQLFEDKSVGLPSTARRVTTFDPRRDVIVESSGAVQGGDCDGAGDDVEILRYEPNEVRIGVVSECPGVLVLTDTWFPGWKATVNGSRVDVLPANVLFRGVALDAGGSTVTFVYEPTSFRIGLALSAVAALAAIAYVAIPRRRRQTG